MPRPFAMILVPFLIPACDSNSDSSPPADAALVVGADAEAASSRDAAVDVAVSEDASVSIDATFTMPEIPPGCPPTAGNENGVGTPCTATGAECTGSLQCSCKDWFGYKMPGEMPCFCTNVAFGNTCAACGSDAVCCTYGIPIQPGATLTISACFPSACTPGSQCPAI